MFFPHPGFLFGMFCLIFQYFRDALSYHKEKEKHSTDLINKLFLRRIMFLKEAETRKPSEVEQGEIGDGEEEGETKENGDNDAKSEDGLSEGKREKVESSPRKKSTRDRSSSRDRRREKKKHKRDEHRREDKRKRKHRDRSRDRSRDRERNRSRDRSRDRERSRDKEKSRNKIKDVEDKSDKKEIKKENGLGSFAALQRRIREENEIVEKRVKDKIEEYISSMVTQQLRVKKDEIEKEVLKKVALARQNMDEEVKMEIDLMKKFREAEEKKKMDEMNARMAEKVGLVCKRVGEIIPSKQNKKFKKHPTLNIFCSPIHPPLQNFR